MKKDNLYSIGVGILSASIDMGPKADAPRPLLPPGMKNLGRSAVKAINWIAFNDNDGNGDSAQGISEYISVALVADVWRLKPLVVGQYIRALRNWKGLP